MSLPSAGVIWSFAPQPAKIGEGGTFTPASYSWYKTRASTLEAGTVQGQQAFPPELGGSIFTSGMYKDSMFYAANLSLIPRMENIMGWLLEAAMGTASSVPNSPVAGVTTHIFRMDPANSYNLPWLASRTLIPGTTNPANLGEIGFDCRVSRLRLGIPNQGKVTMSVSLIGRDSQLVEAPAWTYVNSTFEDSLTTPGAGDGHFKINNVTYPITGLTIDIINGLSTPRQETIVGSAKPYDMTPMGRAVQIRAMMNWQDPDLYQQLLGNSPTATAWSQIPFLQDTGAYNAISMDFAAPKLVGATGSPYRIGARGNRVSIAIDGTPSFQGGDLIRIPLIFTIVEPAAGDFFQIWMENAISNYTWPTS